MNGLSVLYAFLGGALVGCAAAILFAPEKGEDLRARIKELLKKKGIDFSDDEVEQLVRQ
ncbi:MAG: YtxH domain-containing protein, partial [Muribaculaceae bacterium]|nr:YtxH domain-containing protein [Muribaculaceae bacterium]